MFKSYFKNEIKTRGLTDWFCCQFALVHIHLTCFLHDIFFFSYKVGHHKHSIHLLHLRAPPSHFYNQMWPPPVQTLTRRQLFENSKMIFFFFFCPKSVQKLNSTIQLSVLHWIIVSNRAKQIQRRLWNNAYSTLTCTFFCTREKPNSNFQDQIWETSATCMCDSRAVFIIFRMERIKRITSSNDSTAKVIYSFICISHKFISPLLTLSVESWLD